GGGDSQRVPGRKLLGDGGKLQVVESARAVDQEIAVGLKALEDIDHLKQGWVLHDHGVRLEDRLAQADFLIVDPAIGDDRRTHALRPEAWKGLRVAVLEIGGNGEEFRRGDDALSAAA